MASNYPTIQYGSQGASVRQLQRALNQAGYSLDVDGRFGPKTRAAVVDYQKKNKLEVDGVAGNETMGHLLGTINGNADNAGNAGNAGKKKKDTTSKQVLSGVSDETADALHQLEKGYKPSDDVKAAQAMVASVQALKPGKYQSSFAGQLAALYDEISNREAFSYDPAEDATYQRYAAIYTRQGKMAMEDTVGKGAALSGGYSSSYAQNAGQQAYNRYLQELSELVPELEKNAWSRYIQQGEALNDRYALLKGQENTEYERWQDGMEEWYKSLGVAQEQLESLSKQDVDNYRTMLSHYTTKAGKEQSAAGGEVMNSGKNKKATAKTTSLSSAASNSLQNAMDNYLRAGDKSSAKKLVSQYKKRMTPVQKRNVGKLFGKYGITLSW